MSDKRMKRIVTALSDNNEHLKLLRQAGNDISGIYRSYKEFTGSLSSALPCDKYYVLNENGDVTFIGSEGSLSNYVNKFTYRW